jgi:hypothetical protein
MLITGHPTFGLNLPMTGAPQSLFNSHFSGFGINAGMTRTSQSAESPAVAFWRLACNSFDTNLAQS